MQIVNELRDFASTNLISYNTLFPRNDPPGVVGLLVKVRALFSWRRK
jgi:hypothetical protein